MKQLLVKTLSLALLLSIATSGRAQNMDNIYQIEVIIFERAQKTEADEEYWPKSIELAYPPNYVILTDPNNEAQQQVQGQQGSSDSGEFSLSEGLPGSLSSSQASTRNDTGSSSQEGGDAGILLNTFLASKFHTLKDKKNALNRQRGYRILFHETWLQRLQSPDEAPALIITGGNEYGDHRELEGYISLSLSRYLHFHGHLWLTEFVANYGQPPEHWPQLPTPSDRAPKAQQGKTLPISEHEFDAASTADEAYQAGRSEASDGSLYNQWASLRDDPYAELLEAPYLIKNIAVLQQKRKMRSSELHYIDHPKMGILVKVEPRTAEQIRTLSGIPKAQSGGE